ncbi:MAG: hypothetical protein ACFE0J_18835 [Elainellaceae cyanobacterium]
MERHKWRDDARQLAIAPRLWLWWTLATTIAGAIVGALEGSFYFQFTATIYFTGLFIGAAQWLVLRQYMPKAFWWIVVSTQGWTFGTALMSSFITPLFDPLIQFLSTLGAWPVFWSNLVTQPIELAIFGVAQLPILTRFVRKAHWWILVSALGGALDGASSSTVAYIGLLPPPFSTALSYGAGWLSYGIVTGICLQWLLRHHPR